MLQFFNCDYPNDFDSIRAKLRNADPRYDFALNFFIRCLYEDERGNPDSPDIGFLKGSLLMHVSTFCSMCS